MRVECFSTVLFYLHLALILEFWIVDLKNAWFEPSHRESFPAYNILQYL